MAQKIKVGAVSYLNTKPLIYGFEQGMMQDEVDLIIDYPSKIAGMLQDGRIDIGLIPVAAIPTLKGHHIISNYGIACDGEVASVCLFSDVPIHEIDTVILDYQSRTSVALLKILLADYWKVQPKLIQGANDYEDSVKGTNAGLIIGDRALVKRSAYAYIYDLGSAWKALTGLPFIFAAWVSNKALPEAFCNRFNEATGAGLERLAEIADIQPFESFDLNGYYTKFIKFRFNADMHKALDLFLSKL